LRLNQWRLQIRVVGWTIGCWVRQYEKRWNEVIHKDWTCRRGELWQEVEAIGEWIGYRSGMNFRDLMAVCANGGSLLTAIDRTGEFLQSRVFLVDVNWLSEAYQQPKYKMRSDMRDKRHDVMWRHLTWPLNLDESSVIPV
jgi:hypothetical protein